jgi:hypothetical protein
MENLTLDEAYRAMFFFIEELWYRTNYDELSCNLSDLQLLQDGDSADNAAKPTWLEIVERVRGGENGNIYVKAWTKNG